MDQYQQFIHKSRYARWLPEQKRRETWAETVNRYVAFWVDRGQIDQKTSAKDDRDWETVGTDPLYFLI